MQARHLLPLAGPAAIARFHADHNHDRTRIPILDSPYAIALERRYPYQPALNLHALSVSGSPDLIDFLNSASHTCARSRTECCCVGSGVYRLARAPLVFWNRPRIFQMPGHAHHDQAWSAIMKQCGP
jgi:hypothetical protein